MRKEILELRCCSCKRELPHRDPREFFECCRIYRRKAIMEYRALESEEDLNRAKLSNYGPPR